MAEKTGTVAVATNAEKASPKFRWKDAKKMAAVVDKVDITADGFEVADPVEFDENVKVDGTLEVGDDAAFAENVAVDGDLTVNGFVINLNGAVIGVEDVDGVMKVGQYITEAIGDSWTYVGGAYTEDKVLATGITENAVGENGWTQDDTIPVSPNEGEIKYSSMLGAVVLMLDSKKYYTQVNTKLLILESGSYTVVESDYPGYEELTEETFKPFAFEEE